MGWFLGYQGYLGWFLGWLGRVHSSLFDAHDFSLVETNQTLRQYENILISEKGERLRKLM